MRQFFEIINDYPGTSIVLVLVVLMIIAEIKEK